jgi:uncharacterized membrane protein YphA (DoxX/SURF4 family)
MNNLFLGSFCLLVLYVLSAHGKIMDTPGTAKYLHRYFSILPMNLCVLAIYMVIILQIFGSAIILYSAYTNKYRQNAYYTVIAFILFNIASTLIFHFPPVGKDYFNFLKNLSITGGFILLLDRFN